MSDDVLINRAGTIECRVARAREGYAAHPAGFTRHDAAILNIQRADDAVLDIGQSNLFCHTW